ESWYARVDAPATREEKAKLKGLSPEDVTATELAGQPITGKLVTAPGNGEPIGGLKVTTADAWFAARPSGTEDVYKIYAESFRSAEHLEQVQTAAQEVVGGALEGCSPGHVRVTSAKAAPRGCRSLELGSCHANHQARTCVCGRAGPRRPGADRPRQFLRCARALRYRRRGPHPRPR